MNRKNTRMLFPCCHQQSLGTISQANTPRYLHGNFAPIQRCLPLTPCSFSGTIPPDLAGGQYVRNGGNPLTNTDLGRDAHWFDGDGMLSGVLFRRSPSSTTIQPEFVNQYLHTDVHAYASTNKHLRRPVLPSIATLVNPATSLLRTILAVLRTLALVLLSRLGTRPVTRISVANTSCLYHDGRALATCESGPPLRFALPGLDTIGWYDGVTAENEPRVSSEKQSTHGARLGGTGALHWMREWTTAHPRVDPVTNELVSFHSMLLPPYVRYSVIQPRSRQAAAPSIVDVPVPGVASPKMMHDFGVSAAHTVILDLPLSLDPLNPVLHGLPALHFDRSAPSRFGVFPRHAPSQVRWFETRACTIFHTANCWDTTSPSGAPTIHLLACRMTSASLVLRAGNIAPPAEADDQCRLSYYAFDLNTPRITHQWALSALSFEFPSVSPLAQMQRARYVYGCTTASGTYTAALGRAVKITHLVKFDVASLIAAGVASPPAPVTGCVDTRSTLDVLRAADPNDAIRLFALPAGCYAQEPRFVPRRKPEAEDDGWLLTYVFDEAQLDAAGACPASATSELWIIDARTMDRVVARVRLPQRVPYGLHGSWFSEEDIEGQLPWTSGPGRRAGLRKDGLWDGVREACERWVT